MCYNFQFVSSIGRYIYVKSRSASANWMKESKGRGAKIPNMWIYVEQIWLQIEWREVKGKGAKVRIMAASFWRMRLLLSITSSKQP